MFSRLQYITDSPQLAEQACKAGVKWVQARIKNADENTWFEIANDIAKICRAHNVMCIVNDNLEIAIQVSADGVHLGKKDMQVSEARNFLKGRKMLIGGSANTLEDVIFYTEQKVDYMGLGPLRLTSTKKDLNPVLGMDGYRNIVIGVNTLKLTVPPIYAIGGVIADDLENLMSFGVYGVAVSSAISGSEDMNNAVQEFFSVLSENELNYESKR